MTQTVSIMGAEYKVIIGVSPEEDKALDGRYGYCQPTSRLIVIADMDKIPSWDGESEADKKAAVIVTLRHEVLHAFLYESGLWGSSLDVQAWAMNEEMIDWYAIQYPKIADVYEQLGCDGG